ncbi:MAG: hypothetical protein JKY43_08630 [Phycisphaerales bacterium]|nr:hypothetical protein [Phycisphaerales bacterium]
MNMKKRGARRGLSGLCIGSLACVSLMVSAGVAQGAPKAKGAKGAKQAPVVQPAVKSTVQSKVAPTAASSTTKVDVVRQLIRSLEQSDQSNAAWLPDAPTDADYHPIDEGQAELGKLLFHDKILSGNMNISCSTCHTLVTDTSDGLSLPIGEGGNGVGPFRDTGFGIDAVVERVPRNAPHVFNLGAHEFTVMMHDGRIAADPNHPKGFSTPAGMDLIEGLDSAVAAQACFPVTSGTEMAGQAGENEIADAAAAGDLPLLWSLLATRVASIPGYVDLFTKVYPDVSGASDITYAHIANAIAEYEFFIGRSDNSPFDRFLRGDSGAMSMGAIQGMVLFYGQASCVSCHSGPFQTNQSFASIGMPQIGPGKGHNQPGYTDGYDDLGLGAETGNPADNFKFRVPSLRNVALTGPWGHNGAFGTLEAMVRHHLNPAYSLFNYDQSQVILPYRDDFAKQDMMVMNDKARLHGILEASELGATYLTDDEFNNLMDFLNALTDPSSIDLRDQIPQSVPSGLPMFD